MGTLTDLTGMRFGKLIVIKRHHLKKTKDILWECVCDCGKTRIACSHALLYDNMISCGCRRRKKFNSVYLAMISRCYNEKTEGYKIYGARGIRVCDEWLNDYWEFHDWMIKSGWNQGLQIDRYPNKMGNYCPGNCRLVTAKINSNNKTNNRTFIIGGISKTLAEWTEYYNTTQNVVRARLYYGWDIEKALKHPKKYYRPYVRKNKLFNDVN